MFRRRVLFVFAGNISNKGLHPLSFYRLLDNNRICRNNIFNSVNFKPVSTTIEICITLFKFRVLPHFTKEQPAKKYRFWQTVMCRGSCNRAVERADVEAGRT